MSSINNRIDSLRNQMINEEVNAFIVPSSDPHQSEYVCDYWKVRAHFSGFTGSAGTLVVTNTEAALWADSRYFLQVEQECAGTYVKLYKQSIPHAPEHIPWVCEILPENSVIGLDFRLFSKSQIDYILEFATPKNIALKNCPNLIDEVWENRPSLPSNPVEIHALEFSGETTSSKMQKVKDEIENQKADLYFISGLDDIAWLFNIRSNDVDYTPLVISYALVGKEKSYLFCETSRFDTKTIEAFEKLNISILEYSSFAEELPKLTENKKVVTDPSVLNFASFDGVKGEFIFQDSLVQHLKSIKNEVEIENAKKCMVKDGVALVRFFRWLKPELEKREISEYEIGRILETFRKEGANYRGESFSAIVGYQGNGAIIHYTAPEEGSAMVKNEGLLLIDSGAQYNNGTTDITRTIWLGGEISQEIKTAYTGVLKGYIELETMEFPKGTVGMQLDSFARMHLWRLGLNFPHGTGHGIGNYSMVHEPAQGFASSMTTCRGWTAHESNQFTTIEPGCYKKDTYGIRTENVVVSRVVKENEFGTFLGFYPITLCPIDTQLIDKSLMVQHEIDWLNNYHRIVYKQLAPNLNNEEQEWLAEQCKEI